MPIFSTLTKPCPSAACAKGQPACKFEFTAFRFPDSDVVWTSGVLQPETCGGDQSELWVLWRGKPGQTPTPVRISKRLVPGSVVQMIDVNTDGEPEFLVRDWLGVNWRIDDPKRGETLAGWGPEYHDCPC